jgi:hypothetical protein
MAFSVVLMVALSQRMVAPSFYQIQLPIVRVM